MVSGLRNEGGVQVLSAGVRKTIQSIKEIVGNHSDAEIYVALKETNMDPNETTQKLLNQDPFHEVKRKRDRKKENSGYNIFVAVEPRKNTEFARIHQPMKQNKYINHNARRGGFNRNSVSDEGENQKFRVVRDNRVNQTAGLDSKPGPRSTSTAEWSVKSNTSGTSGHQKPPVGQHSSQALNGSADSCPEKSKDATSGGIDKNELLGEKSIPVPSAASGTQQKTNNLQPQSTNASNNSVVGVYSSASDPVHVPSPNSRPAANVGAIRREVGVVGPRRQSSNNSAKSVSQNTYPNSQSGREASSRESMRQLSTSKGDQPSQNVTPVSSLPGTPASRSFSSNQYSSRPHQPMGHQKAPQPNKEWKPKSSLKTSANGSGASAKTVPLPTEKTEDLQIEVVQMRDAVSRLNISENQNVIIASHIRVSESDRCRLTFGTVGTELSSSTNSVFTTNEVAEELATKPSGSVPVSALESLVDETAVSQQLEKVDVSSRSSESNSPASGADHQLTEKTESLDPHNLDNYADVGLVRDNAPSYTPETLPQQNASELRSFSNYDPQMGYDISYFRPMVDDTARGSSSQEVLASHTTNAIPASIAMVQQQQQQQLAQMYPQLHVPHFAANLMPYRQYLSPVYVPPMPVPGYSSNPAYPHPSNGSSYLLMPGNSSHLNAGSVKYGIHQFKPVSTVNPTGFGNFTGPTGYTANGPGVVGSTTGHEDSSRLKYKDGLYLPNPQAETSEIWMNPRDLQSASYYNMSGQAHHTYLPSHSGHASFNVAAAQSSHMQFPGMYHAPTQPAAMASPHHMGPAIGAVPAPGAPVGAYQQPQLGHVNWAGNF